VGRWQSKGRGLENSGVVAIPRHGRARRLPRIRASGTLRRLPGPRQRHGRPQAPQGLRQAAKYEPRAHFDAGARKPGDRRLRRAKLRRLPTIDHLAAPRLGAPKIRHLRRHDLPSQARRPFSHARSLRLRRRVAPTVASLLPSRPCQRRQLEHAGGSKPRRLAPRQIQLSPHGQASPWQQCWSHEI
jgi:hypothetical protein